MNILFLIEDLPSASGQCVMSISSELFKHGHNVTIITRYPYEHSTDGLNILSVDKKPYKGFGSLKRLLSKVQILMTSVAWPFKSLFHFRIYKLALEYHSTFNVDIVIPVYNSIEAIYAGYLLKKRNKIKYIPYFLDALYAGQKASFMSEHRKKRKALYWESKLLSMADGVVMMSPAKRFYDIDCISAPYIDKISYLDLPLFRPKELPKSSSRSLFPIGQKIILYAGSMPRNIRNPKYILEALNMVLTDKCQLYIAGTSDYMSIIEKYRSICPYIHYVGIKSHTDIIEMSIQADILLNIGNSLKAMVPSKIFEYISLGKPIISTFRIDDDPSLKYLKEYNNCLLIDERVDASDYHQLLSEFIDSCKNVDPFTYNNAFYKNTPEAFCKYIEEI